tara:strand:- start:1328 stop:1567 length:240 start_codon:yes stop_codon:yes gene_type:complete
MVDWNMDVGASTTVAVETRQEKVIRRSRVNHSNSSRKARPLMETTNRHLLHSGNKIKSASKLIIRKAKRDIHGNVMISA